MKRFAVVLLGLICLFFHAGQVLAVPIVFDFSAGIEDGLYSEVNVRESGLELCVFATDENDQSQMVSKLGTGLGVYSGNSDSKVLDGSGYDEWLHLFFSDEVRLLQVFFGTTEENDEFRLRVDGADALIKCSISAGDVELTLTGSQFDFGVTDANDDYRIKSITVDTLVPVPEPATFLLLSCGIAGLVGFRQYRERK
ncbi:MAG: PEP-CTERM sorting domain-containing protein [Desulfuromonadales bacterium]|nr:PEP-CTERM sorting domain-containing protein [Chloroflexota bacterium]MCK4620765.1 PEP-CTERM sorting domain-containing protein [Desulfuromonadales bacterium]